MITGDEWRTGRAEAPSPQDMVRHAYDKARLLMALPYYGHLLTQEVVVGETVNGGEYFRTVGSIFGGGSWYQTSETRVLAVFPPPPAPEMKKLKAADLTKAYEKLSGFSVDKGVKRKPKRKKAK